MRKSVIFARDVFLKLFIITSISNLTAFSQTSPRIRESYYTLKLEEITQTKAIKGNDPTTITLDLFGNKEPVEGNFTQMLSLQQNNSEMAVVNLTQLGLPDDSVKGVRYRLEFVAENTTYPPVWQLIWVGAQYICQEGRGSQTWTKEICS